MKILTVITLLLFISCSSRTQYPIGHWKANDKNMTFIFTQETLKIIDVMKISYVKVENIRTFNYSLERGKLKLKLLSFKANQIAEKLPDNVVLHDSYVYEKYNGPKVINCLLVQKDSKTLLFEFEGKKKLILKKVN